MCADGRRHSDAKPIFNRTLLRNKSALNAQNVYASTVLVYFISYITSFVLLEYAGMQQSQDICIRRICCVTLLDF